MPEEAGGQFSKIIIKAVYLGAVVLVLIILISLFGTQVLDTHKTKEVIYQSNLIESCFRDVNEFGYYSNTINPAKITLENLKLCAKNTKLTLTGVNDKEIISLNTQEEYILKLPLCDVKTKNFDCITKKSYVLLQDNEKVSPAYLTIEMVIPK